MSVVRAFVAYPASPPEVGETVGRAVSSANRMQAVVAFETWEQNDIAGRPLIAPILLSISDASILIADITRLNFNVTYEIGYAVGLGRRVLLVKNNSLRNDDDRIRITGIFDTLGYDSYANSDDLAHILSRGIDTTPLKTGARLDARAPVYLLETPWRTDAMVRIVARIKKARLPYRSFVPSETVRLAAVEAITHVSSSFGTLVPLLSTEMEDAFPHNIRAAFVAGLSHGMFKTTLILQDTHGPVPIDVRDFAKTYQSITSIDRLVEDFALEVFPQTTKAADLPLPAGNFLETLSIGDPMAENEFQRLGRYYIRTDQFHRALRGEVNVVVGRKGAGKTALFSQLRNALRADKDNVVVDLKPEGYQLLKLKEDVLDHLGQGAQAHLVTAFWEYLLLLEVCYKVLEKDQERHLRDHMLFELYRQLSETYEVDPFLSEGDFSERLLKLLDALTRRYRKNHGSSFNEKMSNRDITELIFRHDIRELRAKLSEYLQLKNSVWILFDNLDKGWPHGGLSSTDTLILRCLIDAGRKLQRDMRRLDNELHIIIFIRDDVYQLLIKQTADFGKEMRASLDWSDPDLLREMMRRRFVQNDLPNDAEFRQIWTRLCVTHFEGEETSQFLIDRSLMRPRNLLKAFSHCRGYAVNLGHTLILGEDIEKGMQAYSNDLIIEIDRELEDIEPSAAGLLYEFLGEPSELKKARLEELMLAHGIRGDHSGRIFEFLLYYGVLGVSAKSRDTTYVYHVGYDMRKLAALERKAGEACYYVVNPALWPGLEIAAAEGRI